MHFRQIPLIMNYILENKTVVIIGGSSGIGREVAFQAGELGARLIIAGRNLNKLATTLSELQERGFECEIMQTDAHDPCSLRRFFESLPAFDHLVSMVGDVMSGGILEPSEETIRHVIKSKFFTNMSIGRLAAKKVRPGGSLVFTSGSGGNPHGASASYIGNQDIRYLVQALAMELAPHVRVNTVAPFWMDTPFWSHQPPADVAATKKKMESFIPLGRTGSMEEVAYTYIFLIQNTFITGQQLFVDGGVSLL